MTYPVLWGMENAPDRRGPPIRLPRSEDEDESFVRALTSVTSRMKLYGASSNEIDVACSAFTAGHSAESCFGVAMYAPTLEEVASGYF